MRGKAFGLIGALLVTAAAFNASAQTTRAACAVRFAIQAVSSQALTSADQRSDEPDAHDHHE
jgi:hypothetical protein